MKFSWAKHFVFFSFGVLLVPAISAAADNELRSTITGDDGALEAVARILPGKAVSCADGYMCLSLSADSELLAPTQHLSRLFPSVERQGTFDALPDAANRVATISSVRTDGFAVRVSANAAGVHIGINPYRKDESSSIAAGLAFGVRDSTKHILVESGTYRFEPEDGPPVEFVLDRPAILVGDGADSTQLLVSESDSGESRQTSARGGASTAALDVAGTLPPSLARVRMLLREARYHVASERLDIIEAESGATLQTRLRRAEILLKLDKPTEALRVSEAAASEHPDSICARTYAASALLGLGRNNAAMNAVRQLPARAPSSALEHFCMGAVHRAQNDLDVAQVSYARAIELDPDFPEAHLNVGVAYLFAKREQEALAAFSAAIALDERYVEALTNRGAVHRRLGRARDAIEDYSRALEVNANDPMTHYNRGVARLKRQQSSSALLDFEEAIRLKPNYPEAFVNVGVIRYERRQYAAAREAFERAIELAPGSRAAGNARRGLFFLDEDGR